MSYILDALNKSDQERQRGRTPNLKTVHRSPKSARTRAFRAWHLVVLGLVFGNLLLLFLWLRTSPPMSTSDDLPRAVAPPAQTRPSPDPAVDRAAAEPQQGTPVAAALPAEEEQITGKGSEALDQVEAGELITPPLQSESMAELDVSMLPTIAELPEALQRRIPDLTFASHIYSTDPSMRLVSINGRLSRAGDRIAEDLRLLAITEDGVVLEYREHRFRVSVLRDWSFD